MHIFGKSLIALTIGLLSSQVMADVTALNNQNAAVCTKQLMQTQQKTIVVAAYESSCPWWKSYQPIFEKVSSSLNYPASYFSFEFSNAAPGVAERCLRMEPQYCPTTFIYQKVKKQYKLVRTKAGYQGENKLVSMVERSTSKQSD